MFRSSGIYLWPYDGVVSSADTSRPMLSSGFAYNTPVRGERWIIHLQMFNCHVSHDSLDVLLTESPASLE